MQVVLWEDLNFFPIDLKQNEEAIEEALVVHF